MEFLNQVSDIRCPVSEDVVRTFLILLAPFAPHIAEELWHRLPNNQSIFDEPWPTYTPPTAGDTVLIVVTIDGKPRAKFEVDVGTPSEELKKLALEQPNVKRYLLSTPSGKGKEVEKVIIVPDKLVNIVTDG